MLFVYWWHECARFRTLCWLGAYDSLLLESFDFLSVLVAVGDEVVALGVERWIGGDQVDAVVREFSQFLEVVTAD